jgi:hypothetical protein
MDRYRREHGWIGFRDGGDGEEKGKRRRVKRGCGEVGMKINYDLGFLYVNSTSSVKK